MVPLVEVYMPGFELFDPLDGSELQSAEHKPAVSNNWSYVLFPASSFHDLGLLR